MINTLPASVEKYAETKVFDQDTVPQKLTTEHDTKAGVWGRICVLEGKLEYVIPGQAEIRQELSKEVYGVIKPQESHWVTPIGKVKFKVEFYR